MTVSVIIPARNAAAFLHASLISVAQQSHQDLEILVVNDHSTDNTAEIVSAFPDNRVRLICGQGRGAAAARNLGLRESTGQWLMFLDADDLLSREKIGRQLSAIRSTPDAVATCGWGHFTSDASHMRIRPEPCWYESRPIMWLQRSLSGGGMFQTACWLISRHLADAVGEWNEDLSLHDDGEYFTRVALQARELRFVEGCHVAYRRVPGSLSRVRTAKAIASAFEVCRLRHLHLMSRDQSIPTRRALATQWTQVLYEFHDCSSSLFDDATRHLAELHTEPAPTIGGPAFRVLLRTVGSHAAVRIRRTIHSLKRRKKLDHA